MADFRLIQNKINGKWVISAPRRARRTNIEKAAAICPFCPGNEESEEELYRVSNPVILNESEGPRDSSASPQNDKDWSVRVVTNKFPFAPHHEVIIHSPDHHKNWDELPVSQVELIFQTYRQRFNAHKNPSASSGLGPSTLLRAEEGAGLSAGGQVYIFHNRGHEGGESLPHPHTQLVVIPQEVKLDIMPLDQSIYEVGNVKWEAGSRSEKLENITHPTSESSLPLRTSHFNRSSTPNDQDLLETEHFLIFCPTTSEWPDEVWIAPKQNGGGFGMIKDAEITDLSFVLSRLVEIFDLRHGHEFPFNFYIPPLKNWYLRLIPRGKVIGGFELGTNIMVNTQDPVETFNFINEHFWKPDREKIKSQHLAEYGKKV